MFPDPPQDLRPRPEHFVLTIKNGQLGLHQAWDHEIIIKTFLRTKRLEKIL